MTTENGNIDKNSLLTTYESFEDLVNKGIELFGADKRKWLFECPSCHKTISVQQWIDYSDSPENASNYIGFSCLGRLINKKKMTTEDKNDPVHKIIVGTIGDNENADYCNYTAGGLFNFNPVSFDNGKGDFFQFAPPPKPEDEK